MVSVLIAAKPFAYPLQSISEELIEERGIVCFSQDIPLVSAARSTPAQLPAYTNGDDPSRQDQGSREVLRGCGEEVKVQCFFIRRLAVHLESWNMLTPPMLQA